MTTHTQAHPKQLQATLTLRQKKNGQPTPAAPVAHTRYLSSSPAATLHGKTHGFVLRLPPQKIAHATFMQPLQCDLQPEMPKHPMTTHTQAHPKQLQATVTLRQKKNDQPTPAAPVAHTRYLSSSPAVTLHGKTQGFVLRLPPQKIAHATFMQPLQCDLQAQIPKHPITTHTQAHPKQLEATVTMRQKKRPSSLPFLTTSLRHHSPSSSLPFFTTSLRHHFPSSPLPFVTTSLRHHFPSSPLPFVITSLRHHSPSSSLPFFTTSLRHHFPSSPLPFVTTSLRHHFPSSPLPFIITSLRHHFLHHHFPLSPLPFIITSPYSFVMYCYVIYHPSSRSTALLLILLLCIVTLCIVM